MIERRSKSYCVGVRSSTASSLQREPEVSNRVYILRSREFVPRESREIRDANSIGLACSSVSWLANGLLLIWLAACRIIHRRNSWREPRRSSSGWKNADETAISIRKLHAQCEFRRIWREFRNHSLLLL